MPTKPLRFTILFGALLVVASCAPYRDIEVKDITIDNYYMQGSKVTLDFSATVNNPNRAFMLSAAAGELNIGTQPFASAQLLQAIQVPAKSEQRCSGQLQITINDLVTALQMGFNAKSWDLSSMLFTGDLQVRSAWFKKKFRYNEVPLSQVVNNIR